MWLVGMMGSGKSTVGSGAATRVGARFYDTDAMIEEMSQMPISTIWDEIGEKGFRALERRVIATIPDAGCIAAAGGGAVIDAENRDHMRRGEPVVWLQGSPRHLASRIGAGESRPLLGNETSPEERVAELLEARREFYAEVATDVVETDGREIEDVVAEVVELWRR